MKLQTVLLIIFSVSVIQSEKNIDTEWEKFKAKYNKIYKSKVEEKFRKHIFVNNFKFIQNHNLNFEKNLEDFTLEVNSFADIEANEIERNSSIVNHVRSIRSINSGLVYSSKNIVGPIPNRVDWRERKIMTPVKNQRGCDSCWAFAAVGALEARWLKVHNRVKILSEQQLTDCVYNRDGCTGGHPKIAYEYIKKNGIEYQSSYPYLGKYRKSCFHKKHKTRVTLNQHGFIDDNEPKKEQVLASIVARDGPVAVCLKMTRNTFRKFLFYDGRYIFTDRTCNDSDRDLLRHSVTVAGFGVKNKKAFWLFKNSWGKNWGDGGYFTYNRNVENLCLYSFDFPVV